MRSIHKIYFFQYAASSKRFYVEHILCFRVYPSSTGTVNIYFATAGGFSFSAAGKARIYPSPGTGAIFIRVFYRKK